jgi:lactate dehydrogenase-like 2-hydroxyacid dehydrogenase
VVNDATADTAIFLILGTLRGFNMFLTEIRAGRWRGRPHGALGHDPSGKTLGILGMGRIGANLTRKAIALGMKIIYHSRNQHGASVDAKRVSFEELLKQSDVLSLHVPLNVRVLDYNSCVPSQCLINID